MEPCADVPVPEMKVTVPKAPVLENAVTMEFVSTVCAPEALRPLVVEMKVTFPVVFTTRLVKVFVLMFCVSVAAVFVIYVCGLDPATECVIPRMSLVEILSAAAAVPPVLLIPVNALELAAL
jgi:hypothetical protein